MSYKKVMEDVASRQAEAVAAYVDEYFMQKLMYELEKKGVTVNVSAKELSEGLLNAKLNKDTEKLQQSYDKLIENYNELVDKINSAKSILE